MDELAEKLRRLPKEPLSCQGGIVAWPHLVCADDGTRFRPHVPIWVEVESGAMHADSLVGPGEDLLRMSLVSLAGFVAKLLNGRGCPECLEVREPDLAAYLQNKLAGAGIEIRLTDKLPALDRVAAEMAQVVGHIKRARRACSTLKG